MSWIQKGLDIDGEALQDYSGYTVSLSSNGNVVAIGAPYNDGVNGSDSGHVRVYAWNGTSWIKRGNDIDGEAAMDESGCSVSLSSNGNVVAIGATYNDGNGSNSGHVRVYEWNNTSWVQRGIDLNGEAAGNLSGWSVSLSSDGISEGSIIAIGAVFNNNYRGNVRVYRWNGTAWVQRGDDIDGEAPNDISGYSVSLSSNGSVVAIAAPYNSGVNGYKSGHVRVYAWNGSSWVKRGNDIDGEAAYDEFGSTVSLSSDGSVVAIGAIKNDGITGNINNNRGHVRVYEWNVSDWVKRGQDIDGQAFEDFSGYSVSLSSSGNVVAIGAPYNDNVNGSNSGNVRIYDWNGTLWVQRGIDINGEAQNNFSGYYVSLSSDGSIVAIGAFGNNQPAAASGHVRVFEWIEPQNPICYIGESKVLVQDKQTGVESQVCVKDITPEKYLVYSVTQQKFVPIKVNCISGSTDKFILIKKDLLGENKPSEDFYVTPTHPILYKKCEIEAKNLIGAKKVTLEKQLVYSLVTEKREALAINNIDVMCWEYTQFMARYKKSKNAVWMENENMSVIQK